MSVSRRVNSRDAVGEPGDWLPGSPTQRLFIVALLAGLVAADALFLKGIVFGGAAWRAILWLLVGLGICLGVCAYLRRCR